MRLASPVVTLVIVQLLFWFVAAVAMAGSDGPLVPLIAVAAAVLVLVVQGGWTSMRVGEDAAQAQQGLDALERDHARVLRAFAAIQAGQLPTMKGGGELTRATAELIGWIERLRDTSEAASADVQAIGQQLAATSSQHEQGAVEQAAVVEQIAKTMTALAADADQMADSSDQVLSTVQGTHDQIERIAARIRLLSSHVQRINHVLGTIRTVAAKADLLANNAALEGTRAGEHGDGFMEVAERMQRLASEVLRAVEDIRDLSQDIRQSTSASVLATEEAAKRSAHAAEITRQIRIRIQAQRASSSSVHASMDEISAVVTQSVAGSAELASAARQLDQISSGLRARLAGDA